MKKVIVTGGAGFLGSHLVDILLENGYFVYIIDDFSIGTEANLSHWLEKMKTDDDLERMKELYQYGPGRRPRFRIIDLDITNELVNNPWLGSIDRGEIDAIFHLAAKMDVMTSFENPFDDAMRNYIGTINVLEYARKIDCKRVLYRSSFTIYSENAELPMREDSPIHPISPYSLHKYGSELVLDLYNSHHGMKNASFRLFNMYGPRQDPESIYAGVVARFLTDARDGRPLTIYGDGKQSRDFIYVKDAAEALFKAYKKGVQGLFNVGTGKETTINALATMVKEICGPDVQIELKPTRKGELLRSLADMSKWNSEVGYEPKTDLRSGLEETYKWVLGML